MGWGSTRSLLPRVWWWWWIGKAGWGTHEKADLRCLEREGHPPSVHPTHFLSPALDDALPPRPLEAHGCSLPGSVEGDARPHRYP